MCFAYQIVPLRAFIEGQFLNIYHQVHPFRAWELNVIASYNYMKGNFISCILNYSQVPIKRVGPNKQVGWVFYVNLLNK